MVELEKWLTVEGDHSLTAAGIIDMSYDPERGSIKTILTTVDIENEGGSWTIGRSIFHGRIFPQVTTNRRNHPDRFC